MKVYLAIAIIVLYFFYSCSNVSSNQNDISSNYVPNLEDFHSNEYIIEKEKNIDIQKKYLLGKFDPEEDSSFVEVPAKYCLIRKEYIHKDVLESFIQMYEAAAKEGVNLKIISAHRTFYVQKWLWDQKYHVSNNPLEVVKNILKYTAMPGTSRHHWGTDIDFLSTKLEYFNTPEGKKAYNWLKENALDFGFFQVYDENRKTGYNEEKWHWSYIPVAKEFEMQYKEKITYEDFEGFNGSEFAEELNIIEDYVLL